MHARQFRTLGARRLVMSDNGERLRQPAALQRALQAALSSPAQPVAPAYAWRGGGFSGSRCLEIRTEFPSALRLTRCERVPRRARSQAWKPWRAVATAARCASLSTERSTAAGSKSRCRRRSPRCTSRSRPRSPRRCRRRDDLGPANRGSAARQRLHANSGNGTARSAARRP